MFVCLYILDHRSAWQSAERNNESIKFSFIDTLLTYQSSFVEMEAQQFLTGFAGFPSLQQMLAVASMNEGGCYQCQSIRAITLSSNPPKRIMKWKKNRHRMKWTCMLPFLFIFFMWAFARPNPYARPNLHDDQELVCSMNLACGSGIMKEFDTRNEAHMEKRSILENEGGYGEDASVSTSISEDSVHRDYAVSDPPPVTRRPSKEPVHYRIFWTPPISSPIP